MTSRFEPGFPAPDLPPGWVRDGSGLRCLACRREAVKVQAEREGEGAKGVRAALVAFELRRDPTAPLNLVGRRSGSPGAPVPPNEVGKIRAELRRSEAISAAPKHEAADRADAALREDPDATAGDLARRSGVSERTISRRRRALIEAGEIERRAVA